MAAHREGLAWVAAALLALTVWGAGPALAGGEGGGGGCCTPPPCCMPPPPPPPPPNCYCHNINIPGVNVNVGATVIVNANALAIAGAASGAGSQSFFGGGGGTWSVGEAPTGLIQGLLVEGEQPRRVAYQASRTKIRVVVIQAVCIDDQEIPHPASQVTPDKDIDESYEGELYRCIAGTHMQVTIADYDGKISFDRGQVINCAKGEALYKDAKGEIACRPQKPARDCNERSLLRRYGAGVKILKIVTIETYTAYREEAVESVSASSFNMTIDGGVGGVVH
jgi:hypothetical protein